MVPDLDVLFSIVKKVVITISFFLLFKTGMAQKNVKPSCYYKAINHRVELREILDGKDSLSVLLNEVHDSSIVFSYRTIDSSMIGVLDNFIKYYDDERHKMNASKNMTFYSIDQELSVLFLTDVSVRKFQTEIFELEDIYLSNGTVVMNLYDLNHAFKGRITVFPERAKLKPEFFLYKKLQGQAYTFTIPGSKPYTYENFQTESIEAIAATTTALIREFKQHFKSDKWTLGRDRSNTFYIRAWTPGPEGCKEND